MELAEQQKLVADACKLQLVPQYIQRYPGFLQRNGELTSDQIKTVKLVMKMSKWLSGLKKRFPNDQYVEGCVQYFLLYNRLTGHHLTVLQKKYNKTGS